jgi:DNA repair and recombination protein RAD52
MSCSSSCCAGVGGAAGPVHGAAGACGAPTPAHAPVHAAPFGQRAYTSEQSARLAHLLSQDVMVDDIAHRKGASNTQLSYLEGHKVVEIANNIFGPDGWSCTVEDVTVRYMDAVKNRFDVGVSAQVRVMLANGAAHSDIGWGDATNMGSKSDALEKSIKQAVTDARKRALKNFGRACGGSLYDKRFLGEAEEQQRAAKKSKTAAPTDGNFNLPPQMPPQHQRPHQPQDQPQHEPRHQHQQPKPAINGMHVPPPQPLTPTQHMPGQASAMAPLLPAPASEPAQVLASAEHLQAIAEQQRLKQEEKKQEALARRAAVKRAAEAQLEAQQQQQQQQFHFQQQQHQHQQQRQQRQQTTQEQHLLLGPPPQPQQQRFPFETPIDATPDGRSRGLPSGLGRGYDIQLNGSARVSSTFPAECNNAPGDEEDLLMLQAVAQVENSSLAANK